MIIVLIIILAVLVLALWISTMILWWKNERGQPTRLVKPADVVHTINKAARLARRSYYNGQRYTRKAASWSEKKAAAAFVTVFPKAKEAFVDKDPLTGLEHGPSSYFLASLSSPKKKNPKKKASSAKAMASREKHLSEE